MDRSDRRGIEIGECGHVASSAGNDLAERFELETVAAGDRGRPACGAAAIRPMTRLASSLVNRPALVCSRGARCRTARGERIIEAELVDGRPVLRREIHHSLGGIRGVRTPVRSTASTRQRDRLFESRRSEQPFVAHLRDPLAPRGALVGGQDVRVHIVRRHRAAAANGGGTVGYGCVGHACSPGM